jgi:hypothetical protein
MFDRTYPGFVDFIRESNRIEGILRDPTEDEIAAHERLMKLSQLHTTTVGNFQAVIAPGKPLRERPDMNVRVGNHIAPDGGPNIIHRLQRILSNANDASRSPWSVHVAFETLHPYMDGNGRTGRAYLGLADATIRARSVRASVPASVLLSDAGHEPLMDGIIEKRKSRRASPGGSFISRPNQTARRFSAEALPFFGLATTSKETFCPSLSPVIPARSTALMCTKTSLPPSSDWMNP